jgi:hypothetical protein
MKKINLRKIALYTVNILIILLMGYMLFRAAPVALAGGYVSMDGDFNDWSDQVCMSDPTGDASGPETDITQFCYATNAGESNAYFMIERLDAGSGGKSLELTIYFSTNGGASYDYSADISYKAFNNDSNVTVNWSGGGDGGDWGLDRSEGANKVEWYVPFSAMGIAPGQTIDMYVVSWQGSSVSDGTYGVQWSPANALGWILIAVLLVGGSIWLTFLRRTTEKATIAKDQ